jgi:hypothetical protein
MKLKILLLALFVAGLAASIALASPSSGGTTGTATTATGTTAATTTGKRDDDHKGRDKGCRSLELRGTAGTTSLSLTVDRASKAGRDLVGKQVSLTLSGTVRARAKVCGTGSAQTIQLRDLKVSAHTDDH